MDIFLFSFEMCKNELEDKVVEDKETYRAAHSNQLSIGWSVGRLLARARAYSLETVIHC